ncbi:inorganic pyrophosphatase [Filimonas sp.]|nr:inorganic pyrophosphatase [Filimonas sp.]
MSIVTAHVIGVMRMIDKGMDDKIIAVCANDISVSHITSLDELPPHLMSEIRHFFEQYKKLEHTEVVVEEFMDKEKAFEIITQSILDYKKDILPDIN